MRWLFALLTITISCNKFVVEKPKIFLDQDKMAEVMVDFTIIEQSNSVKPDIDMENATKYVLKKHGISGKTYQDNYTYYSSNPTEMQKLLKKAEKKLLNTDENLEDYIEKQNKGSKLSKTPAGN